MSVEVVVRSQVAGALHQEVTLGNHSLAADEPREAGGEDRGPGPYALLCAALGTCTSMTLTLYAKRKQWPLERVTVRLKHEKLADVAAGQQADKITREVALEGKLDEEQRARLLEIANKCPVHKTLTAGVKVETTGVARIE